MASLRVWSSLCVLAATALHAPPARAEFRYHWPEKYPGIRAGEYVAIGALLAANLAIELAWKIPEKSTWSGPVLFDNAARDAFKQEQRADRDKLTVISDLTLHMAQFQPIVLDAGIAAVRGSWITAWNIEMMSALGAGITGVLTRVPLHLLGRDRPDTNECKDNPEYHEWCNRGPYASFPSGHTSFAFTGAALSCAHHQALKLWDSRVADITTCVVGLTLATTTAVTRLMMDRHWASDVLVGAGVGLASGFAVPYLLHYGRFAVRTGDVHATVVPATFDTALGARVLGLF